MAILAVGIDFAKNVFALHGVCAAAKPQLVRRSVVHDKPVELLAALPP
jgi:transposase